MKVEYPKMIYKNGESMIVKDADEHQAAGDGWGESPVVEEQADESENSDDASVEGSNPKPKKKKGLFGK